MTLLDAGTSLIGWVRSFFQPGPAFYDMEPVATQQEFKERFEAESESRIQGGRRLIVRFDQLDPLTDYAAYVSTDRGVYPLEFSGYDRKVTHNEAYIETQFRKPKARCFVAVDHIYVEYDGMLIQSHTVNLPMLPDDRLNVTWRERL